MRPNKAAEVGLRKVGGLVWGWKGVVSIGMRVMVEKREQRYFRHRIDENSKRVVMGNASWESWVEREIKIHMDLWFPYAMFQRCRWCQRLYVSRSDFVISSFSYFCRDSIKNNRIKMLTFRYTIISWKPL